MRPPTGHAAAQHEGDLAQHSMVEVAAGGMLPRWVKQPAEEDYDEAVLSFTRVRAMDAADAAEVRAALAGAMFGRRPDEMCSLYQGA